MFLGELNDTQKRAFLYLAHRLSLADQILSRREQVLLAAMRGEMGMDPLAPPQSVSEAELAEVFDSRPSRLVVLIELLTLAHVDGSYDDEEKEQIMAIARPFGIAEAEVDRLTRWVEDLFDLEGRGRQLVLGR